MALVSKATLNKKDFDKRLETVQKSIKDNEELEQKIAAARTAVEKAEQDLSDDSCNQAVKLIDEIPNGNTLLTDHAKQVKQKIDTKKEEDRKQAEAAKAAAAQRVAAEQAAAAQAQAEAEAQEVAAQQVQAKAANEQPVMVTRTGSKYHTHKCGYSNYYAATLSEAQARGLEPCSKYH